MSALCSVPAAEPGVGESTLGICGVMPAAAGAEPRARKLRVPVPCPTCGYTAQLERMTPEMLWFRCGSGAKRGAVMPDGRWAVLAGDVVVSLNDEEWRHYRAMCKHAEEVAKAAVLAGRSEAA